MSKKAIAEIEAQDRRDLAYAKRKVKPPWRPIETAPRDGRYFLLAWMDCDRTWNHAIAMGDGEDQPGDCRILIDRGICCGIRVQCPVAWMPLPCLPGKPRQELYAE